MNNEVVFGQGYENNNSLTPNWNYDGNEPGGNFVRLDIHGDNNKFKGSQKQDSTSVSHDAIVYIYADEENKKKAFQICDIFRARKIENEKVLDNVFKLL